MATDPDFIPLPAASSSQVPSSDPDFIPLAAPAAPATPDPVKDSWGGLKAAGQRILERAAPMTLGNAAALVDLAWSVVPQIPGLFVETGSRIKYRNEEKRIRDIAAQMEKQQFTELFDRPLGKLMQAAGFGDVYTKSDVEQVMQRVGQAAQDAGDYVEKKSGGGLSTQDFLMYLDAVTAGLGAAGAKYSVGKLERRFDPLRASKAVEYRSDAEFFNRLQDRLGKKETLRGPTEDLPPTTAPTPKLEEPPVRGTSDARKREAAYEKATEETQAIRRAVDANWTAEQTAYDLMRRGASADTIDRVARRLERQYPGVGRDALSDAMAVIRVRRELVEGSALGTPMQDMLSQGASWRGPRKPGEAAVVRGERTGSTDFISLEKTSEGGVRPAPEAALDSAIEKVKAGKRFDLTAEEKIALRDSTRLDKKILTGLGAAGAAALLYTYDADIDAQMAGSLIGLGALVAMPEKAPLGAFLRAGKGTLKTLERLPSNRFEFSLEEIRNQLKRQDVTGAEREAFEAALRDAPDRISAKELMTRLDETTGVLRLGRKETSEYASYGLENIGRLDVDGIRAAEVDHARLGPQRPDGSYQIVAAGDVVDILRPLAGQTPEEAFAQWQGRMAKELEAPSARTTLYTSPLVDTSANHFGDRQYFAHTRSFMEDGVEHVVELQSDLVAKAGKTLTPEAIGKLEREEELLLEERVALRTQLAEQQRLKFALFEELRAAGKDAASPEWQAALIKRENANRRINARLGRLATRFGEISRDLAAARASTAADAVKPLHKNWHKRLIREKILEAQERMDLEEGAPKAIRFADADTVAKVEGWYEAVDDTLPPELQSIYDRYAGDITKTLQQLGAKHVEDAKGYGWWEVDLTETPKLEAGGIYGGAGSRRIQLGAADPELLRTLAAGGLAAGLATYAADKGDEVTKALVWGVGTAAAMLAASRVPALREAGAQIAQGTEYIAGVVSSRVRDISEPVLRRMTNLELATLRGTYNTIERIEGFANSYADLPDVFKARLKPAILTNDSRMVEHLLSNMPQALEGWKQARAELGRLGARLEQAGLLNALLPDYFPRMVVDLDGLLEAIDAPKRTAIQVAIEKAALRAGKKSSELSDVEISQIVNLELSRSRGAGAGKPGFTKKRAIGEIDESLARFYAEPDDALIRYVQNASRAAEKAEFFGKHLVKDESGLIDLDNSIGNIVRAELEAGRIDAAGYAELESILRSRFFGGERAGSALIQNVKNGLYAMLLSNVTSAAVQLSDTFVAAAANGVLPAIRAMTSIVTRQPDRMRARDFGLVNHAAEELTSARFSQKWLAKAMGLSGFTAADLFSKSVFLQSNWLKWQAAAKTAGGVSKLRAKYGDYFREDFDALVSDLQAGRRTNLVDELAFRELSNYQPTSRIEVPQAYLDNPNGRALYMLKTWMIKQADAVRAEMIRDIKAGRTAEGTMKGLRYGLALGLGGASMDFVRNWLLGRDQELEWGDIPANTLKTFGLSEYTLEQVVQGNPVKALGGLALPPWQVFDDLVKADEKTVRYLPIAGQMIYNHGLGGAEKWEEAQARFKRQAVARRDPQKRAEKELRDREKEMTRGTR